MIRHRLHHWSCSRFADLIRGNKKPFALELNKWDEWKTHQQKERPFRFWLSDTVLDKLQDIIYYPLDIYREIKFYIRNRWIDKTHYMKTGLTPGHYYEFDHRLIHSMFNELVDYVEIELSHLSQWDRDKKYHFKNGRCIEAAYDYFEWASKDKNINEHGKKVYSEFAKNTKKVKKLYEWWKNIRPNRLDPMDASGWSEYYDNVENNKSQKSNGKKELARLTKIEEQYDKEDENMMIELIKLRKTIWT
jgi:hypothetical protein